MRPPLRSRFSRSRWPASRPLSRWPPSRSPARPAQPAKTRPATDGRTGRQIYDEVLANRFRATRQNARLVSGDRSDNALESRMTVLWKTFRDENDDATEGVFSKTVVRYTHPFDLRFSAYLVINNEDRPDDQFVYLNSRRRTRRVNLRGEPVLGSDFGFEDVIPREIEDAEYKRLPDDVHDGRALSRRRDRPAGVGELRVLAPAKLDRQAASRRAPHAVLGSRRHRREGRDGARSQRSARSRASGFPCTPR